MRLLKTLPLGVLLALPALASTEGDLERIGQSTAELVASAEELDHQIAPGRTHLSHNAAIEAFEDNLYLLLIGKNRQAAEGFFGLVTTGALQDPSLHRDAEWHLAEALYGMGNIVTAEARFKLISEDPKHAFREDAVRRLLELYAETGDAKNFYELYESEIVQGRVKPTPLITYTVARSFYKQGDFAKARTYFEDIAVGTSHHNRARYFMGVMAVRESRLADAERFFQEAADASIGSPEQRDAHDLAVLALARLAYERDDYQTATDKYQSIGGDSKYLDDVLYETVWTFIKQEHYAEALQGVELFLLAFPEHQYSGELRVVQGHLHMGCGQTPEKCLGLGYADAAEGDSYDKALSSYESIVLDYQPIRERFGALVRSQDEPKLYFEQVLALDNDSSADGIPEFALAMMKDDVELADALEVYANLQRERADLEACEAMVNELEVLLASDTGLGGFESARYTAVVNRTRAVQEQVGLLGLESSWLSSQGANTSRYASDLAALGELSSSAGSEIEKASAAKERFDRDVAELRARIAAVEAEVKAAESQLESLQAQLSDSKKLPEAERARYVAESAEVDAQLGKDRVRLGELRVELSSMEAPKDGGASSPTDELAKAIKALRKNYEALRPDPNSPVARRIDELHGQLEGAQATYVAVQGRLGDLAATELGRVRERFAAEAQEVAAERSDLETTSVEADRVAVALTREGFERMESFFADSVLKADMGIVDVYWARKLELADERERVQNEKNALVAELGRRFELIRQKMEQ
ncbi:MAG: tetratricopeptide repeat protein [Myxococcota bacterium]